QRLAPEGRVDRADTCKAANGSVLVPRPGHRAERACETPAVRYRALRSATIHSSGSSAPPPSGSGAPRVTGCAPTDQPGGTPALAGGEGAGCGDTTRAGAGTRPGGRGTSDAYPRDACGS